MGEGGGEGGGGGGEGGGGAVVRVVVRAVRKRGAGAVRAVRAAVEGGRR